MKIKSLLLASAVLFAFTCQAQTVTDFDGNEYNTVTIGTQVWMKENLKALHYANGTEITGVSSYENNESNVTIYGRLYNWTAAMHGVNIETAQGACPTGWHIPSVAEYDILIAFLGGESVAGGKMKEAGLGHWASPNTGADNTSNFTALPGGFWMDGAGFLKLTEFGKFWTSTDVNGTTDQAYNATLRNNLASVDPETGNTITTKLSVRCIQGVGVVGINHNTSSNGLQVYPNPASQTINVVCKNNIGNISIYSILGELVLKQTIDGNSNEINISNLSAGMYLVCVESGNETLQKKLVVK